MQSKIKRLIKIGLDKKNKSLTKQLMEGSAYIFSTNIITKLGGLIFTLLLARVLLPDLFGLYNIVLSLILTISSLTDLGIGNAISRYLADSLSKGKKYMAEARSRVLFLFKLKFLLSLITSIILFSLAQVIAIYVFRKPEVTVPLRIGSIYLFVMSIQGFFWSLSFPLKKLKYNLVSEILFEGSRIVLFLVLVLAYKSVSTVFWVLTASYLISAIFYMIVLFIKHKKLFFGKVIPIERRKMTIFLGWSTILSSSLVLFGYIGNLMLGIFVETNFIAYYSAISSLVSTVIVFITFNMIFLPIFTEIRDYKRLERSFRKIKKAVLILAIPSTIVLAIFIIPLIKIIYGPNYVPTEYFTPILISSILLSLLVVEGVLTGIYNSLFVAKEKIKISAIVLIISTALNIILNYFFVQIALPFGQQWALVAVAVATVLTRYANLITLAILSKKKFGIS
jgi:O-antigen/teichoic acid export membrane protein